MLLDELFLAATQEKQLAINLRRYLHENPEPSYHEAKTAALIVKKLREFGIDDLQTNVGNGFGIVARIHTGQPGLNLAFRADFDALKVTEKTDLPFKSKNPGVMHACGHDAHTAGLLVFAKIINHFKAKLCGTITLLFQNAEETQPGGAKSMVAAGALEGVDYVFGIHLNSLAPVGTIAYCEPFGTANSDTFKIKLAGKKVPVAEFQRGANLAMIASQIITALQALVSQKVAFNQPAVLTFATVAVTSETDDEIAAQGIIKGTVRTFQPEAKETIKNALLQQVPLLAQLQGGQAEVDYLDGYPSIKQSMPLLEENVALLKKVFGEKTVVKLPMGMGGEDFSYFSKTVSGIFLNIGAGNEKIGAIYPHHSPNFKIDEGCLDLSVKTFLTMAAEYLAKKE
jgi:amidohydrolase